MPQHACRHHFGRSLVAEEEDRQAVIAATLGAEHLLQDLPLLFAGLGPVDRYEPARFIVENFDQPLCVGVAQAGDDPKTLFLDGRGQHTHAAPGCTLSLIVLVDDGDRKRLQELHGPSSI